MGCSQAARTSSSRTRAASSGSARIRLNSSSRNTGCSADSPGNPGCSPFVARGLVFLHARFQADGLKQGVVGDDPFAVRARDSRSGCGSIPPWPRPWPCRRPSLLMRPAARWLPFQLGFTEQARPDIGVVVGAHEERLPPPVRGQFRQFLFQALPQGKGGIHAAVLRQRPFPVLFQGEYAVGDGVRVLAVEEETRVVHEDAAHVAGRIPPAAGPHHLVHIVMDTVGVGDEARGKRGEIVVNERIRTGFAG